MIVYANKMTPGGPLDSFSKGDDSKMAAGHARKTNHVIREFGL